MLVRRFFGNKIFKKIIYPLIETVCFVANAVATIQGYQQLTLFRCRLARGGAEKLKKIQLFGPQIASRRASRRFAGERFLGGDARREASWEREVIHVFQWEKRDAIWTRASCVSAFRRSTMCVERKGGHLEQKD